MHTTVAAPMMDAATVSRRKRETRELLEAHALDVRRQIAQLQSSLAITEHKTDHLTAPNADPLEQGERP